MPEFIGDSNTIKGIDRVGTRCVFLSQDFHPACLSAHLLLHDWGSNLSTSSGVQ